MNFVHVIYISFEPLFDCEFSLLPSLLSTPLNMAIDGTRIFSIRGMEMHGSDEARIVTTDSSRLTLTDT